MNHGFKNSIDIQNWIDHDTNIYIGTNLAIVREKSGEEPLKHF